MDGEEEGSGGGLWSRLTGQSSKKLKNITLPRSELELPFLIAQVNYDPEQFPPHFAALSKIFKVQSYHNGSVNLFLFQYHLIAIRLVFCVPCWR